MCGLGWDEAAYAPKCGALCWWGSRSYRCELESHSLTRRHENNSELPGVSWLGDHTPPCADCPPVLPDGSLNERKR
jgi:hypothetical protein